MTIDTMQAGPALDAEVARRVFGIKKPFAAEGYQDNGLYYIASGKPRRTHAIDAVPLPRYSIDPAAACLVVEAMRARGCCVVIQDHPDPPTWRCEFIDELGTEHRRTAETFPLAVCRAALAVLGDA